MYLKCKQCVWAEDDYKDNSPLRSTYDDFDLMFLAMDVNQPPLSAYQIMLQYHIAGDLVIDTDVINLVSGFLKWYPGCMGYRLLEGRVTAAFNANILFVPISIRGMMLVAVIAIEKGSMTV